MNPVIEEVRGEIILPAAVKRQQALIERSESAVEVAVGRAEAVRVSNHEEATQAAAILKELATQKKNAEASRKELVGPLNAHVKKINGKFKQTTEPLEAAERVLRSKLSDFQAEVERLRQAEEDRLRREAAERERKLREERERVEREAREAREAAEQKAREAEAEARKQAAEAADAQAAEEAARAAEAAAAQLDEAKLAERTLDALPNLPAPVPVVPEARKIEGIQTRKVWDFDVLDPAAVPREFLKVDEVAIRAAVRAGTREIPGVRIEQKTQAAVR